MVGMCVRAFEVLCRAYVSRTPCFFTKLNTLALSWPLDSLKSYLYPNLDVAQYRSSWGVGTLKNAWTRGLCVMRELSRSGTQMGEETH